MPPQAPIQTGKRSGAGRPLTVLQILPDLESGGVERGVIEVSDALVAQGHRSLVVSGGGRLVEELESNGSKHVRLSVGKKSPATLRLVGRLRDLLLREQVDVLHARSRGGPEELANGQVFKVDST